ncbi:T9SS type A sorting domain-containing protein [Hymenobacter aerilatus]|uniref:T9SS type A sorting domain-containing protein n=1 Tax=Hymenobacter aerilatus TaxID=2932251 RepID=A0A8T9SZ80_9BACT|nr:T9SS type A sorting domain-containing protein [Hymenobacter aerilatus]UOR06244.1 T9SS type A sorting domain-containing protein [Hymenobacter aerilatus]
MRQNLYQFLALLILLLCGRQQAVAQVQSDVRFRTASPQDFMCREGISSSKTPLKVRENDPRASWVVTLYKPESDPTEGYVEIFPEKADGTRGPAISAQQLVVWPGPRSGIKEATTSGQCDVKPQTLSAYTQIRAVFTDRVFGKKSVSDPIPLQFITTPPPTTPPPTTPPPTSPCGGINPVVVTGAVYPCGDVYNAICGDQCVPYNSAPTRISGRALANNNDASYLIYMNTASSCLPDKKDFGAFSYHTFDGKGAKEEEQVQWQYSYNNRDWYDISGATDRNFQPGAITRTTYYRRVSTHLLYRTGLGAGFDWDRIDRRDHWYTSNVVKIGVPPPPPETDLYGYGACAGSSFKIRITPADGDPATTTNWSAPNANWRINGGQGVIYQSSHNVGGSVEITVDVPANTPAGNYEMHVSSQGPCGSNGYKSIQIIVGMAPNSYIDGPAYISTNPYATSTYYLVGAGNSNIQWSLPYGFNSYGYTGPSITLQSPGYETEGTLQATYTDQCGNINTAQIHITASPWYNRNLQAKSKTEDLTNASPENESVSTLAPGVYPNPASSSVTIVGADTESTVSVYDNKGVLCKSAQIPSGDEQVQLDVQSLSSGVYQVRSIKKGVPHTDRLIIQH